MSRPNVIWIMSDQHRAQALGCMGDLNVRTPNLDYLAMTGTVFDRCISNSPICSPARAILLTGRWPHQNGVWINGQRMRRELPTVATAFGGHGYRTAWFGKWHVDNPSLDPPADSKTFSVTNVYPVSRAGRGGFETWIGYENNMNPQRPWVQGHDEDGREVEPYPLGKHDTDGLMDLLVDYIGRRGEEVKGGGDRPFFATISTSPPHDPYVATPEFAARYSPGEMKLRPNVPDWGDWQAQRRLDMAGYCAMIEQIDHGVGRVIGKLREMGLYDNTHIIYFSDHGDMMGSQGMLRKAIAYEEALRIPCIISGELSPHSNWDGRTGGFSSAPISLIDLAVTSLGLCGLEAPAGMGGRDFSGYRLRGKPTPDVDSAYGGIWQPITWDGFDWPWRVVTTADDWKYVAINGQPAMMFNLKNDPYEQFNLIGSQIHKPRRRELHALMRHWIEQMGDPFELGETG